MLVQTNGRVGTEDDEEVGSRTSLFILGGGNPPSPPSLGNQGSEPYNLLRFYNGAGGTAGGRTGKAAEKAFREEKGSKTLGGGTVHLKSKNK